MNILGIETSTRRLCVGLMNHRGRVAEYNIDSGIRHTELLLPTIKKALAHLKLSLKDIDYFTVGLGPGSFTGLRIGLATIKGFTAARNVPVVGVPSLDVIASNALPADSRIICPIIDAKRNLLFAALYKVRQCKLRRISPYLLITLKDLLKRTDSIQPLTFLGDGLAIYRQRLKKKFNLILNEDAWYPKAQNLIKLSVDLIKKGRLAEAAGLKPIYLYPKECQIR